MTREEWEGKLRIKIGPDMTAIDAREYLLGFMCATGSAVDNEMK